LRLRVARVLAGLARITFSKLARENIGESWRRKQLNVGAWRVAAWATRQKNRPGGTAVVLSSRQRFFELWQRSCKPMSIFHILRVYGSIRAASATLALSYRAWRALNIDAITWPHRGDIAERGIDGMASALIEGAAVTNSENNSLAFSKQHLAHGSMARPSAFSRRTC
jgi:hypothetical protein